MNTIKEKITAGVLALMKPDAKIIRKFKDDDLGPYFSTIFFWQEVKKYSESALDAAWKIAASAKVVPDDDDLRDKGQGEHIISDSRQFSFIAKVDKPRQTFDQETFIKQLAERFKLNEELLTKMAANCLKDSKPPLSKRILEVGK